MNKETPMDFLSFSASNSERVNGFDYLHIVYKDRGLHRDFITGFTRLFWPEFKLIEGYTFIAESFDLEYFESLSAQNKSMSERQYWMNLIEITGMFDDLTYEEAMFTANAIASSWNSKIALEIGNSHTPARAVHDAETGEVFVTLGSAP